ncbi:MAG: leucine dehydrogenase, partial [Gammaproteobacteria bacterium]|nr:leucine dehydrogenase [Gammaproteobacteria bacterium]
MISYQTLVIPGFEKILRCWDPESGLRAVIAVHDTTLGPAMGGCRMWRYASEDDALADAQRLARGMTFKAALAGLPLGGGKAVIIGDPRGEKSPELFRAFGRAVEQLHGTYVTGEDVGTSVEDM